MKIGAQLYTVRGFCRDINSLDETLGKVAAIGYKYVQLSGVCAYDTKAMSTMLKKHGLECTLTHFDVDRIQNDTLNVIAEHKLYGCENIGMGGMNAKYRGSPEAVQSFIDDFSVVGETMRKNGARFMYHNHAFELRKFCGKTILDMIAESFPRDDINFTLDTYWIQAGGGDPVEYLHKLAGRIECIHLKDMAHNGTEHIFAPIYEGNMNFDMIIPAAREYGAKYAYVEQDDCYGEDPFECLKKSFENCVSRFPWLA